MNTPKTNLSVLAPASAYQPDSLLSFNHHNREVLRITADGRLVTGEGLSVDEATQEAAKLLIASFEEQIQKMVEKRIAATKEGSEVEPKEACSDHQCSKYRNINGGCDLCGEPCL